MAITSLSCFGNYNFDKPHLILNFILCVAVDLLVCFSKGCNLSSNLEVVSTEKSNLATLSYTRFVKLKLFSPANKIMF